MLLKRKIKMDEGELKFLESVREAWHSAKAGLRVCMVTKSPCGWDTLLGKYHHMMIKYVEEGLIYHKVENTVEPSLELTVEDLESVLISVEVL